MSSGQTIIIRKKKGGNGHAAHHGGAWKVAFADFMTAMMAFFLVMWILGLSESTRKSIAGYFREPGLFSNLTGKGNPMVVDDVTESLHRGDGSGATNVSEKTDIFNIGPSPEHPDDKDQKSVLIAADKAKGDKGDKGEKGDKSLAGKGLGGTPEGQLARAVAADLRQLAQQSPALRVILGSITLQITGEGVRVELVDNREAAYFDVGSARPNPAAQKVLNTLASSLSKMPNKIEIEGHTDSRPFWRGSGYTNWELSADRANAVRKLLVEGGVSEPRIAGISGMAATHPRVAGQPLDVTNRRVALILRREESAPPTKVDAVPPADAPGAPATKDTKDVKEPAHHEAAAPAHHEAAPAHKAAGLGIVPISPEEIRAANH